MPIPAFAGTSLDVALCAEALGEDAQRDRPPIGVEGMLAGAGRAADESEATFAGELLNAPAECLDATRDMQRIDRYAGGERVPFEAIERQELLVHASSSSSCLGR